jgi:hypothetical protein
LISSCAMSFFTRRLGLEKNDLSRLDNMIGLHMSLGVVDVRIGLVVDGTIGLVVDVSCR